MSNDSQCYDVAICGAGLAGLMLAARLSHCPGLEQLTIAVIEARPLPETRKKLEQGLDSYDPRVSAITAASQAMFEDLGLWQKLPRKQAYSDMYVWDADGTGNIAFDAASLHQPRLGHIVENSLLLAELLEMLRYSKNVSLLDDRPVARITPTDVDVQVDFEDASHLRAGLLVGADGANSLVRRQAGFETREWDYGHHAIVCTVGTERPHQNTAWQRFLPSGPLAFLPLQGEGDVYSSIVWSVDEELAPVLMADDDAAFLGMLGFAFEHKLGEVKKCSRRFSFPLRQRHAQDYVKANIALVGDAAHTIHPLAGQGINLGFQDVAVLSDEIARAVTRGLSPGDLSVLQRYQRRRKPENLGMMAVMEGFKRLFGREDLPLRLLRSLGMQELNRHSLAKRKIIEKAMGL